MNKRPLEDMNNCCGCGACFQICPTHAIRIEISEDGFYMPIVDKEKCIDCGLCTKICHQKKTFKTNVPQLCKIMTSKDDNIKMISSSGGAFAIIANYVIEKGGYVVGAELFKENKELLVSHIIINKKEDIEKLQGSKYVQSKAWVVYDKIKTLLNNNMLVLFTGTPCQVAALQSFLGKKYDNLITMDIICHGVPGIKMFNDYIKYLENKKNIEIENIRFRDKRKGWGYTASIEYKKNNKIKEMFIPKNMSSYYYLFGTGEIIRKSCFTCEFAGKERVSDITIGDCWGIFDNHSKILKDNISTWASGISCILINTEKGKILFNSIIPNIYIIDSNINEIAKDNKQLNKPLQEPKNRDQLIEKYKENGYNEIEKYYQKNHKSFLIVKIKNIIPYKLKFKMKCKRK